MPQKNNTSQNTRLTYYKLMPLVVEALESGKTATLHLKGISMRPFLEDDRDKALLTSPKTLKEGDAVLALLPQGFYVLHRIMNINGENLILRGDGNFSCEYCKKKDVIAIAIGFYRKGRNTIDRTDGLKWKVYSFIWNKLFFIRRPLLFLYKKLCLSSKKNK